MPVHSVASCMLVRTAFRPRSCRFFSRELGPSSSSPAFAVVPGEAGCPLPQNEKIQRAPLTSVAATAAAADAAVCDVLNSGRLRQPGAAGRRLGGKGRRADDGQL